MFRKVVIVFYPNKVHVYISGKSDRIRDIMEAQLRLGQVKDMEAKSGLQAQSQRWRFTFRCSNEAVSQEAATRFADAAHMFGSVSGRTEKLAALAHDILRHEDESASVGFSRDTWQVDFGELEKLSFSKEGNSVIIDRLDLRDSQTLHAVYALAGCVLGYSTVKKLRKTNGVYRKEISFELSLVKPTDTEKAASLCQDVRKDSEALSTI